MVVISWQLLLSKFPSRENSFKWKSIGDPDCISCILCGGRLESASHHFVTCNFASSVWYRIFQWLWYIWHAVFGSFGMCVMISYFLIR